MVSVIASKYLATNVNRLAQGPDTLLRATNVVNDDGQLRPRRGQELLSRNDKPFLYLGSTVANRTKPIKVFFYNNRLWVYWRNTTDVFDGIGYYDFDTGIWRYTTLPEADFNADSGMFLPQIIEIDRRLMLASKYGIYSSPKMDTDEYIGTTADTIQTKLLPAGVMRALPFSAAVTVDLAAYANNWLANGAKVAYVHVWRKTNANGTVVYGAPSSRIVVTNAAGVARGVQLTVRIPKEILDAYSSDPGEAARYSCEIYRTFSSNPDGTGTAPDPGANYYLALELRPTTTELSTNFEMIVSDMQADLTLQDPLYTNETEDGAIAERVRPPLCRTLANFQNCAWFGNTTSLWRLPFNIQAIEDGGAANKNGIRANDVVIIGDWAFEAVTGAPNAWQFKITTTTGYTAQISRITASVQDLVKQYNNNRYAARFNLHLLSGPDDFVGKLMLEEQYSGAAGDVTPYIGLYRQNGWAGTSDAVPVSPVPLVSSSVGVGRKIVRATCAAPGTDVILTLDAAPDFSIGDTVNVARINGNNNAVWALIPQGQYVVKNIVGNDVTLNGHAGGSAATYQIGVGYYVGYNLLGAMHCVIDKSTGAVCQAVGDRDRSPHRAHYSTPGEPESSPLLNYLDFGSADKSILAMQPLADSLFVFKEDGLYRVVGYYPDFFSSLFDQNITLLGPDMVTQMNGLLYAMTTKGVYEISEQGAKRISFDIQNELDYIVWNNQSNVRVNGFMTANQSDQRLMLWLPEVGQTKPTVCFVFDGFGWTKRDDQANYACSGVRTDTANDQIRMYTAKDLFGGWITQERKSMTIFDYCDESLVPTANLYITGEFDCTITFGSTASMLEIPASFADKFVGAILTSQSKWSTRAIVTHAIPQGPGVFKLIVEMYDGQTLYDFPSTTANEIALRLPIKTDVQFNILAGNPEQRKHWSDVRIFFSDPLFTSADLTYASDVNPTEATVAGGMKGFAEGVFGSISTWNIMLNTSIVPNKTIKREIPVTHTRGSQLKVGFKTSRALEFFSIYGFSVRDSAGGMNIERNNNL